LERRAHADGTTDAVSALAESLGLGVWAGLVSALVWLAAGIPPIFLWESTLAALVVVGIVFLIRKSFGVMSTGQVVLSGVLWGALLLLQPVAIVVLPFWLLLLHLRSRCPRVQTLVLGVIPILIVAPWMVRDVVVFHSPVLIRDNFGLELAVSNNPCASALFEANDQSGCWALTHPNYRIAQLRPPTWHRFILLPGAHHGHEGKGALSRNVQVWGADSR